MINGSTDFNNAVVTGGYPYIVRISTDDEVLDCNVSLCTCYKGSVGTESFGVGTVFTPYVELAVTGLNQLLENSEILVEVGVQLSSSTEWINLGYYKVIDVKRSAVKTTLTAVGRITSVLSTVFPTLEAPVTISSILSAIQTSVRATGLSNFTITANTVTLSTETITADLTGQNGKQLLEVVTSLIGGYATEDSAGNVLIFKYSDSYNVQVDGSRMIVYPTFSDYDFTLTNIKVIKVIAQEAEDESAVPEVSYQYSESLPLNWTLVNEYMENESMFDTFCSNCIGLAYRPATITLAHGDPRIEGTDVIQVEDVDGTTYLIPAFSVVQTITGSVTTTIIAPGQSQTESDTETKGPISQQIDVLTTSVGTAQVSASLAKSAALQAQSDAAEASESALRAEESAGRAEDAANSAVVDASRANSAATDATISANAALQQLSQVEDVFNVLNWVALHGEYSLTTDTVPIPEKWYFEQDGDSYLVVVPGENDNPATLGLYELSGVDKAITNYISTHLTLDNHNLWVQSDGSTARLQISAQGIALWSADGNKIAEYSDEITLGDALTTHMTLSSGELAFWRDETTKVAYISADDSESKLYITHSEITNTLRLGNFIWRVRNNSRISLSYSPQ